MRRIIEWMKAEYRTHPRRFAGLVGGLSLLVGAGLAALIANIAGHQADAQRPYFQVVELNDDITDPAVWGRNYPLQYESYLKTVDQKRTRYGGSEAIPRTPTEADPRSIVAQSKLEEDERLKTMWAGYAFSKDFREERGHAYMLTDQRYTGRHAVQQAGTCINCHASVYVPFKRAGNGNLFAGFAKLNQMKYEEAVEHVEHAVSCIDCHDPQDMSLRVTRPAFIESMREYMASVHGVRDYDVNEDASRQEMRSYVCGQCHVEYYFKGDEKRLTFPWTKGLRADDVLAYYEAIGFKDWTHAETKAPALKAQHPEFEMWQQGIHARSGVACADCHMPYERVGAFKVSNHHVKSPMLDSRAACGTCHNLSEDELKDRVRVIQDNHAQLRDVALDALMDLIRDIKAAQAQGVSETKLTAARNFQRRSQFLLGFVEAENSGGFHAPQEAARVLGLSIDLARKGQNALR